MVVGGLLAKAAVGSEIARNGLVGTIKGVGDILAGIRSGIITIAQDVQKMTGNWTEPKDTNKKPKTTVKEKDRNGEAN